jgi:hypothetical protein
MKKEVILQFPCLLDLWKFRAAAHIPLFEISASQATLSCQCSEEEVQLAISKYHASVVSQKKIC